MDERDPERVLEDGAFVRALARDLAAGAADVDDLVQEAWLRALSKPARAGFSPRAWLAGLLRNVARERRRGEERRERREREAAAASEPPAHADDPAALTERLELVRRMLAWVDDLAEPQRTALLLRYLDGLEPAEIARRLGVPDRTVRSRIKRGLDELRARLDRESGGDRAKWMAALLTWALPQWPAAALGAAAGTAAAGTAAAWNGGGLLVKSSHVAALAAGLVIAAGLAVRAWWTGGEPAVTTVRSVAAAAPAREPLPEPAPEAVSMPPAATRIPEAAERVAPAEDVDPARNAAAEAASAEWRIEGVLRGLDPSIPWTGKVRVAGVASDISDEESLALALEVEPDGTFAAELPGLAPRSQTRAPVWRGLEVSASDPRYVDVDTFLDALDDRSHPCAAPHTFQVALETGPSARVHGRVVDEGGRPVPGASVSWDPWDPHESECRARTDAKGEYRLESSRSGPVTLQCGGRNPDLDDVAAAPPGPLDGLLATETVVELRAGVDLPVPDVVLWRGESIVGEVVDANGDPVAGALVRGHCSKRAPDALSAERGLIDTHATP
jgi:RNA polymerase sigma-70 factor (ECF subfamily)